MVTSHGLDVRLTCMNLKPRQCVVYVVVFKIQEGYFIQTPNLPLNSPLLLIQFKFP